MLFKCNQINLFPIICQSLVPIYAHCINHRKAQRPGFRYHVIIIKHMGIDIGTLKIQFSLVYCEDNNKPYWSMQQKKIRQVLVRSLARKRKH